jgi:predicted transposase/invertase (TIGR01784 family)
MEVKQTAFRIDGVFTPKPDSPEIAVIFVEFQFQKDEVLYERLFSEIMLYLAQNPDAEDWQAIAIYPRRSIEQKNRYRHRTLLNSEQFQAVYLEDFLGMPSDEIGIQLMQLIVSRERDTDQYLEGLVEQLKAQTVPNEQGIIRLVSTIMVYKFPQLTREEIESMFTVSDLKQTKVYQEALDEGIEQGLAQGMQQGLTQGMQQALEEAVNRERSLLLRQLNRKIGEVPQGLIDAVQALYFEQLEILGEALFDFEQPADLEVWLGQLEENASTANQDDADSNVDEELT